MPALRSLSRVPLVSSAVTLTFAVATAILAIVFALVWHILVRQLPYPDAERLVFVWNRYGATEAQSSQLSPPDFNDYRHARSFAGAAAYTPASVNLTEGEPRRLSATKVTSGFFDTLGVSAPRLDEHSIILSDAAWRTHFGARRDLVGNTILLDGVARRVAAVMPASFAFPDHSTEAWIPLELTEEDFADANRGNENLLMIARMRKGVTVAQAQAEIDVINRAVFHRVPDRVAFLTESKWHVALFPLRDDLVRRARPALLLLMGAALLVALLAAANVTSLFLARTVARQRELAVRSALGASVGHLLRVVAFEALLLASVGIVVGLFVARITLPFIVLQGLPRAHEVRIDAAIVIGTAAFVLFAATIIGFGVAAWSRRAASSATRLRAILVGTQVAIAVTLLVSGAMLFQTYQRLRGVELGFDPRNVLTFAVELPRSKYKMPQRQVFFSELQTRLKALPGVVDASAVSDLPFSPNDWTATFHVEGVDHRGKVPSAHVRVVLPEYARAMRIPVLRGRFFTTADREGALRVCLIDDEAARRYWPGQNPVGKRVQWGETMREVVGVVGSVRTTSLADDAEPHLYLPLLQRHEWMLYGVVRTNGDAQRIANDVRTIVRSLDPAQPVFAVQSMDAYLDVAIMQPRLRAVVVAASAIVAILLALTGLYALLAYVVTTRTREVGLRIALGATPAHVMRFVVRWALRITAAGIVAGLAGALVMTRAMRAMLFGIDPLDPATYVLVALAFALVAIVAAAIPAARAARIDPAVALRQE
ncbi:MAG TPA: ADOP family duplicated permease [Thermoanaerobaculia bacterium]|jgi:putative ABC transport system permease protein|nr:ADOP family duplicated permease [Thermoanaerobaculia bacterium]